jgi:hypothetical protein
MSAHYDLKRDTAGWTVFDRWTGRPVVIALVPQVGLSFAAAVQVVDKLNRRGGDPADRKILQ